MNLTLFWLLFIGLQSLCLFVAYKASKLHHSASDYYLAGRTMSFFPLLMTFVATQVGGGLILGSAEKAYEIGWQIVFYPLGHISGFILLGTFLGKRLAALPVSTVAEIFEYSYGSKNLKKLASALSILTLFMITVAQVLASQKFLAALELNHPAWFAAFWAVIFIYTMWGGLAGIAGIDVIQATFFLLVFAGSLAFVCFSESVTTVSLTHMFSDTDLGSLNYVGWFLMPCLFMLIEQDMAQRCFSAKSSITVKKAAFGSAFLVFFASIIPISFGMLGKANAINVPKGQSVLMALVQVLTSPAITAAVACAVMMAIISTAVSLIHSISTNLTQDFKMTKDNSKRSMFIMRSTTLGIGFAALFASSYFEDIVNVLIQSYELSVVCLFVPVFMSLIQKQRGSLPAALAIAFGAASFVIFRVTPAPIPREILELMASGLGFAIGWQMLNLHQFKRPS